MCYARCNPELAGKQLLCVRCFLLCAILSTDVVTNNCHWWYKLGFWGSFSSQWRSRGLQRSLGSTSETDSGPEYHHYSYTSQGRNSCRSEQDVLVMQALVYTLRTFLVHRPPSSVMFTPWWWRSWVWPHSYGPNSVRYGHFSHHQQSAVSCAAIKVQLGVPNAWQSLAVNIEISCSLFSTLISFWYIPVPHFSLFSSFRTC